MARTPAGSSRAFVLGEVRRQILTLELAPGTALSENDLAGTLGVSRTPVREALILLAGEGLVEVFAQVGSFVALVDKQRVLDAQFLREAVEVTSLASLPTAVPDAAEPGAAALDLAVLARLRSNLEAQRDPDLTSEDFFALDEEFHRELLTLAGHAGVWPSVVSAKGHLDRARRLGLAHVRSHDELVAQHSRVLDAVLAGDPALAAEELRTHLRAVLADIERIEAAAPDLFARPEGRRPVRRVITELR